MVDVTLGSGGHAGRIAEKIGPSGHLIGLDLDPEAIGRCRSISTGWPCRVNLVQAPSDELERVLRDLDIEKVDGILADLGVSSPQIDQGSRGFSFQKAGPLDMRMDPDAPLSAAGFLASASEQEIRDILRKYGEELRAHAIAKAIARERNLGPIETTDHLTRVILSCFPDGRGLERFIQPPVPSRRCASWSTGSWNVSRCSSRPFPAAWRRGEEWSSWPITAWKTAW